MKKIIPLFTILFATLMLSGCVIFWPDEWYKSSTPKYKVYFHNQSSTIDIEDWYLKDSSGTNHVKSSTDAPVSPGEVSCIDNLSGGYYTVYYRIGGVYYHTSASYHINSNSDFWYPNNTCTVRN